MDLKEFNTIATNRHPWETARLQALKTIIHRHLFEGIRILDMGCGDGYISQGLFSQLRTKSIRAVDLHLTDDQLRTFNNEFADIRYSRELPDAETFDLLLLLDVLEHVQDDVSFLADLVARHLSTGGKMLLTVPAFQSIYGRHDINLGHFRRYSLTEIETIVVSANLRIIASGYLFSSLLLPKYILCSMLKIDRFTEGIGRWNSGRFTTRVIESMLNLDNSLLLFMSRIGVRIPGLTGWVLCTKLES